MFKTKLFTQTIPFGFGQSKLILSFYNKANTTQILILSYHNFMKLFKTNIITPTKCILMHPNSLKAISQSNIIFLHKILPETCIFSAETQTIYEVIILVNTITSNHTFWFYIFFNGEYNGANKN
jgi:hypothetical protein